MEIPPQQPEAPHQHSTTFFLLGKVGIGATIAANLMTFTPNVDGGPTWLERGAQFAQAASEQAEWIALGSAIAFAAGGIAKVYQHSRQAATRMAGNLPSRKTTAAPATTST